ncbi:hypothetical protein SAMD00019534_011650 [Acytostelium subglobosum LB1]|uniref:hypothetical protein n=1 Tax=Acytostelium subglobosum LB1 TaxID=1410327 RepID=UPI0006447ECD|nr:hypothetical protein SAMD00019534_011650 [Acytostelium subglobosum LB1]GAM17990.1 hypothetical protein SAMD00019534_011650 [Acytostelium subglobosum LB1]|eukprot:XP_012758586.1 hypothetical protein SAMD00019534_011650 [Acytostelium subglobosum LB1]
MDATTSTPATPTISFRTIPDATLYAINHKGPYYGIGKCFQQVAQIAATQGVISKGVLAGLFYDNPATTPESELRSKACFYPSAADLSVKIEDPAISTVTLRGGEYAVFLHKGPYETLPAGWMYVFKTWRPASGREVIVDDDHPTMEIYLNDYTKVASEDLLTELLVALQ